IVVIDPAKNLEKKLDRLTDVQAIILKNPLDSPPEYLKREVTNWDSVPVFNLSDTDQIAAWIQAWMGQKLPPINGLVLAGGESRRMQKDKGELVYYGKNQREHVLALIRPFCSTAYLS